MAFPDKSFNQMWKEKHGNLPRTRVQGRCLISAFVFFLCLIQNGKNLLPPVAGLCSAPVTFLKTYSLPVIIVFIITFAKT